MTPDVPSAPDYQSKNLDHLGLVSAMIDELGIVERIDTRITQDKAQCAVTVGQSVKAMILNGLGFANHTLYLTPHFFQDKPTERLIGPGVTPAHLNDDRLGRSLDALHRYGIESLYLEIAAACVTQLGLSAQMVHLDSTSLHTDAQASAPQEEGNVIQITRGYSRDHRPDLNQVVLQLLCEQQAGIPLIMQSLSGNSSDTESFRQMVEQFLDALKVGHGVRYLIVDAAWYTSTTLTTTGQQLKWISRAPDKIGLVGEMVDAIAPELTTESPDRFAWRSVGTTWAGVNQRWVVCYSPEARQRSRTTLAKRWAKASQAEQNAFDRLCRQPFACEEDARKALAKQQKKMTLTQVTDIGVSKIPRYSGKGRPSKAQVPERYDYFITGTCFTELQPLMRQRHRASCFVLASNELDHEALSDEALIAAYKNQQKVERGFRFIKDPLFMAATLFLKSPKRIMALMMIMTLSLLVYSALEYRIRQRLKETESTFPDQKGKPTAKPSARWVFQAFQGIHLLVVQAAQEVVLNLKPHQSQLLALLGQRYSSIYGGFG